MNTGKLKLAVAAIAIPLVMALAGSAQAKAFTDLFIFGDSYSDTGASFPLTNGTTAAAYLGALYGIPITTSKNANPGTQGVNFAESGARIASGTAPRSLTLQVGEFQSYVAAKKLTFDPSSSLFFLLGGLNDHNSLSKAAAGAATTAQVQTLYNLGGRYFEIALLPSLVPAFTDSANNLNPEFRILVPLLQTMFPDATFKLSNWGGYYDDILANPSKYGMTDVTNPCLVGSTICSNPDQHFYYYSAHPSDASHKIVGRALFAEALAIPEPMTMGLLGVGALGLVLSRRRRKG